MRLFSLLALAAWLCLAGSAVADADSSGASGGSSDQGSPAAQLAPTGPVLQPTSDAPIICDPSAAGFHYLEVRGSGFDAWAMQHLIGNVVDSGGAPQMQWNSIWVSPQGSLTLELNLCADPFRNRPALPAGNYTVSVGMGAGRPIAATSIALSPPSEAAPASADQTAPDTGNAAAPNTTTANPASAAPTPTPSPTQAPFVLPNVQTVPTPTPLPALALPTGLQPTPTPTPRTGPGTRAQPFPMGAPGLLADGWQLLVTGVSPDAYTGIKAVYPTTTPPGSDQKDYIVRVLATYQGTSTASFSGVRLALLSTSGTVYDQLHNTCGTIPTPIQPNLQTPGGQDSGEVCFTVRATDIPGLLLFDNQSTSDTDREYFALS